MIRSCELKDTYLAGYLDDDRKLSFETAARAKLECNKGKKCLKKKSSLFYLNIQKSIVHILIAINCCYILQNRNVKG